MVKTIKEDKLPIFIYPEGTRNRTDEPLKEFYDGAFRLALETQVPIIAQTLIGAKKIYHPNHPLQMQPGLVHIYFDKIDTTKYGKDEVKKLKDDVKQIMWNRIVNHPK
jgi:1-acyl-sn-glycerol-3-phosphate acyltransferase